MLRFSINTLSHLAHAMKMELLWILTTCEKLKFQLCKYLLNIFFHKDQFKIIIYKDFLCHLTPDDILRDDSYNNFSSMRKHNFPGRISHSTKCKSIFRIDHSPPTFWFKFCFARALRWGTVGWKLRNSHVLISQCLQIFCAALYCDGRINFIGLRWSEYYSWRLITR